MRGKRAKIIRALAENETVGLPQSTYDVFQKKVPLIKRDGSAAKGADGNPIILTVYQVRLTEKCTRFHSQQLKRAWKRKPNRLNAFFPGRRIPGYVPKAA